MTSGRSPVGTGSTMPMWLPSSAFRAWVRSGPGPSSSTGPPWRPGRGSSGVRSRGIRPAYWEPAGQRSSEGGGALPPPPTPIVCWSASRTWGCGSRDMVRPGIRHNCWRIRIRRWRSSPSEPTSWSADCRVLPWWAPGVAAATDPTWRSSWVGTWRPPAWSSSPAWRWASTLLPTVGH